MERKQNETIVHNLKLDYEYFADVANGKKSFEIRKDDRPYEAGDFLFLQEYDDNGYTGEYCFAQINYVFGREDHEKEYMKDGYVTLGIGTVQQIIEKHLVKENNENR